MPDFNERDGSVIRKKTNPISNDDSILNPSNQRSMTVNSSDVTLKANKIDLGDSIDKVLKGGLYNKSLARREEKLLRKQEVLSIKSQNKIIAAEVKARIKSINQLSKEQRAINNDIVNDYRNSYKDANKKLVKDWKSFTSLNGGSNTLGGSLKKVMDQAFGIFTTLASSSLNKMTELYSGILGQGTTEFRYGKSAANSIMKTMMSNVENITGAVIDFSEIQSELEKVARSGFRSSNVKKLTQRATASYIASNMLMIDSSTEMFNVLMRNANESTKWIEEATGRAYKLEQMYGVDVTSKVDSIINSRSTYFKSIMSTEEEISNVYSGLQKAYSVLEASGIDSDYIIGQILDIQDMSAMNFGDSAFRAILGEAYGLFTGNMNKVEASLKSGNFEDAIEIYMTTITDVFGNASDYTAEQINTISSALGMDSTQTRNLLRGREALVSNLSELSQLDSYDVISGFEDVQNIMKNNATLAQEVTQESDKVIGNLAAINNELGQYSHQIISILGTFLSGITGYASTKLGLGGLSDTGGMSSLLKGFGNKGGTSGSNANVGAGILKAVGWGISIGTTADLASNLVTALKDENAYESDKVGSGVGLGIAGVGIAAGLSVGGPLGAVIGGAAGLLGELASSIIKANDPIRKLDTALENLDKTTEEFLSTIENTSSVDKLIGEYKVLQDSTYLTSEQSARMNEILSQIQEVYPDIISERSIELGTAERYIPIIERLNVLKEKQAYLDLLEANKESSDALKGAESKALKAYSTGNNQEVLDLYNDIITKKASGNYKNSDLILDALTAQYMASGESREIARSSAEYQMGSLADDSDKTLNRILSNVTTTTNKGLTDYNNYLIGLNSTYLSTLEGLGYLAKQYGYNDYDALLLDYNSNSLDAMKKAQVIGWLDSLKNIYNSASKFDYDLGLSDPIKRAIGLRAGLNIIPRDDYKALLHKDEMVLTASQADYARSNPNILTSPTRDYSKDYYSASSLGDYKIGRVPYDNYPAILGRGEQVVNAGTAAKIRALGGFPRNLDDRDDIPTSEYIAATRLYSSSIADRAVQIASQYLGYPYIWGGKLNPWKGGFDCSGLVSAAYTLAGFPVSKSAAGFGKSGITISKEEAMPGDFVTRGWAARNGGGAAHVGLVSGVGGSEYIHAASVKRGIIRETGGNWDRYARFSDIWNNAPLTDDTVKLASGGIVTEPTRATIGEQSKKEAIIPLESSEADGIIDKFSGSNKVVEVIQWLDSRIEAKIDQVIATIYDTSSPANTSSVPEEVYTRVSRQGRMEGRV